MNKFLFIGQCELGSTSRVRCELLCDIALNDLDIIDVSLAINSTNKLMRSLGWRFFIGPLVWKINRMVHFAILEPGKYYKLIWIDKGVFIHPTVLRKLKKSTNLLVHYTPDTAFLDNNSRFFKSGIDCYDFLITTKLFELEYYFQRVSKQKIIYLSQGYNSFVHYPRTAFANKSNTITFIGLYEPYRAMVIHFLVVNGFNILLGGFGWTDFLKTNIQFGSRINFLGEKIINEQYSEAISKSKFALGFLSKKFPEMHTTRTFEIPASGTCLITEANEEINSFFTDEECLKYIDLDDLLKKINFFLNNPKKLESVILAGSQRVRRDMRDYQHQMKHLIGLINNVNP